jgi:hypothetical protein
MAIRPAAMLSNPAMHRSAVVLPQPLGPRMQPIRPRPSASENSFSTRWPL